MGCGWGVTLDALEGRGYRAIGMDVSRRTLEALDRPGRRLIEADLTRPLASDVPTHDAVLALDVIEHLDDDSAAVRRLGSLTKPGGLVVVSVPALPELYGEFDGIQGHRRRYLPQGLRDGLRRFGPGSGAGLLVGPMAGPDAQAAAGQDAGAAGRIRRRGLPALPQPAALAAGHGRPAGAFAIERRPAIRGRLRIGTSLFAVARRPHRGAS